MWYVNYILIKLLLKVYTTEKESRKFWSQMVVVQKPDILPV